MAADINKLMKQAQEMQNKMQEMQEQLANLEIQGEAGAGAVKVVMTGRFEVKQVSIDDSVYNEGKEMLEDLVAAAVNDGVRNVEKASKDKMSVLKSAFDIDLPSGSTEE